MVTGQTVSMGTKKEGGHDQTITVANDRMASISHDDGLYVKNDRKMTVEGKQEQTTTGDHVSLVKGTHSLEVKGDLARKVKGALGIRVEGDIVLESSGSISLKAGGSFIVIHSGGVDIMGLIINLNGGGSPGTPAQTLQPAVLEALTDDEGDDAGDEKDNSDSGDGDDEQDNSKKYYLRFHFTDDDSVPYVNTKYVAHFADGTQKEGVMDGDGYTEVFIKDNEEEIKIHLFNVY